MIDTWSELSDNGLVSWSYTRINESYRMTNNKVLWPLGLGANAEVLKNEVINFLLRAKRAKFVLDNTRRWMWKERGTVTVNRKHRWLMEQKTTFR
nr:gamma-tubulin complex component 5-like [Tanacetum cinerariifolium]